jgi:hypothetical protein
VKGQKIYEDNLLRDFAALMRRYPSREWSRLADLLENGNARSQIILFLRGVAGLKRASAKPTEQKARVAEAKDVKGEKKEYVDRVDLDLARRSTRELRELARKRGLSFSTKDSRQRLIRRLLGNSSAGPGATRDLERHDEDPSDYAQWAEIIMGRNRR